MLLFLTSIAILLRYTAANYAEISDSPLCQALNYCKRGNMDKALIARGLDQSARTAILEESDSIGRRCSCHPTCIYFGTCCSDAQANSVKIDVKVGFESASKCLGWLSGSGARVVDRCPSKTSLTLKNRCEGSDSLPTGSTKYPVEVLEGTLPYVTSVRTKLTYKNKHCARCAMEKNGDLLKWELIPNSNCQSLPGSPCKLKQIPPEEGLKYGDHVLTLGYKIESRYLFSSKGVDDVCDEHLIRQCPPNTDSELNGECLSGETSVVQDRKTMKVFANIYCARCNDAKELKPCEEKLISLNPPSADLVETRAFRRKIDTKDSERSNPDSITGSSSSSSTSSTTSTTESATAEYSSTSTSTSAASSTVTSDDSTTFSSTSTSTSTLAPSYEEAAGESTTSSTSTPSSTAVYEKSSTSSTPSGETETAPSTLPTTTEYHDGSRESDASSTTTSSTTSGYISSTETVGNNANDVRSAGEPSGTVIDANNNRRGILSHLGDGDSEHENSNPLGSLYGRFFPHGTQLTPDANNPRGLAELIGSSKPVSKELSPGTLVSGGQENPRGAVYLPEQDGTTNSVSSTSTSSSTTAESYSTTYHEEESSSTESTTPIYTTASAHLAGGASKTSKAYDADNLYYSTSTESTTSTGTSVSTESLYSSTESSPSTSTGYASTSAEAPTAETTTDDAGYSTTTSTFTSTSSTYDKTTQPSLSSSSTDYPSSTSSFTVSTTTGDYSTGSTTISTSAPYTTNKYAPTTKNPGKFILPPVHIAGPFNNIPRHAATSPKKASKMSLIDQLRSAKLSMNFPLKQ